MRRPLLVVLNLCVWIASASYAQYLIIDMESPSSITACSIGCAPPGIHTYNLHDNDRSFKIYEHGVWHVTPWKSPSQFVEGIFGLGFDATVAPDNENVADRAEVAVARHGESWALAIGKRRYLRFYMKIHSDSHVPQNWTLVHQAWQCCSKSPPFALHIKPDPANPAGDIVVQARVRNDSTAPGSDGGIVVWEQVVQRGQWYEYIFQYQPSFSGFSGDGFTEGQLALWFDGASSSTFVYRGDFGYDFVSDPDVSNVFDLRVGVYRRKQERRLKVFFDYIVYGSTAASVGL